MTSKSTGAYRTHRGSGCVGLLPASKPGNPYKARRRTKPLVRGRHTTPQHHDSVFRGMKKQRALVERVWMVRRNPVANAVRWALGK